MTDHPQARELLRRLDEIEKRAAMAYDAWLQGGSERAGKVLADDVPWLIAQLRAAPSPAPGDAREVAEQIVAEWIDGYEPLLSDEAPALTKAIAFALTARDQAARVEEREAIVKLVERVGDFGDYKREELTSDYGQPKFDMMHKIIAAIRALSSPPGSAG